MPNPDDQMAAFHKRVGSGFNELLGRLTPSKPVSEVERPALRAARELDANLRASADREAEMLDRRRFEAKRKVA